MIVLVKDGIFHPMRPLSETDITPVFGIGVEGSNPSGDATLSRKQTKDKPAFGWWRDVL